MEIRQITECRLCRSKNLVLALKLADIPIADGYTKKPTEAKLYPDEVWICEYCGHMQMGHMLSPEIMFGGEYLFHSGDSPSFVQHLREEAEQIVGRFAPKSVLEVGSNDGTLLKHFSDLGVRVFGVDPAGVTYSLGMGDATVQDFFTEKLAQDLDQKFDCIVANHVFAHADDLNDMLAGIKTCLADDGVFVFENAYGLNLVRYGHYDQIYHEHPSYHTVKPLRKFVESHGLELFAIKQNHCKGGSIRGFVQHKGGKREVDDDRIMMLIRAENFFCGVGSLAVRAAFDGIRKRLEMQRAALPKGKVVGYGAASSCTPVIFNMGLQDRLLYLVDDSKRKQGLYAPGSNVPVLDPSVIGDEPVVIVALRFAEQIAAKYPNAKVLP